MSRRWVQRLAGVTLVLLSIPALAAAVVYFWMLPYFDDVAPGSLVWYIALPGYLTAAPTPRACGEPRYSHHFIDGLKPGDATVEFRTRASLTELRATYADQLAACRPAVEDSSGFRFECGGAWRSYDAVILQLDPGDGCRRAILTFLPG